MENTNHPCHNDQEEEGNKGNKEDDGWWDGHLKDDAMSTFDI